jgi:hypothetical protein
MESQTDTKEILDFNQLQMKYEQLQSKYIELDNEHKLLKYETSENVIIESMNDMKKRYDAMIRNTVSLNRYESLSNKYNKMNKVILGSGVLINRVLKIIQKIHSDSDGYLLKAEIELNIIKEILEETEIN